MISGRVLLFCFLVLPQSLQARKAEKVDVKKLFLTNCSTCHGNQGLGDGPASAAMKNPKPRNFVADNFKNGDSAEQIYETIGVGIPPLMPAWRGTLTDEERRHLADYVLQLRKQAP